MTAILQMGDFLRKVAGAFVYLDEPRKRSAEARGDNLDDLARETGELVAQLGGTEGKSAASTGDAALSPMQMTASDAFAAAGIADGANSAQRVLKIIAGLSMFPREQQLVMVRAMDAADDTWAEAQVLDDAEQRQAALRRHWQLVDAERMQQLQSIATRAAKAQADGQQTVNEIDQRIAELQKIREQAIQATSAGLHDLEVERTKTEEAAARSRHGITTVSTALSDLITFFKSAGA